MFRQQSLHSNTRIRNGRIERQLKRHTQFLISIIGRFPIRAQIDYNRNDECDDNRNFLRSVKKKKKKRARYTVFLNGRRRFNVSNNEGRTHILIFSRLLLNRYRTSRELMLYGVRNGLKRSSFGHRSC